MVIFTNEISLKDSLVPKIKNYIQGPNRFLGLGYAIQALEQLEKWRLDHHLVDQWERYCQSWIPNACAIGAGISRSTSVKQIVSGRSLFDGVSTWNLLSLFPMQVKFFGNGISTMVTQTHHLPALTTSGPCLKKAILPKAHEIHVHTCATLVQYTGGDVCMF